jgi:hypothetical protein
VNKKNKLLIIALITTSILLGYVSLEVFKKNIQITQLKQFSFLQLSSLYRKSINKNKQLFFEGYYCLPGIPGGEDSIFFPIGMTSHAQYKENDSDEVTKMTYNVKKSILIFKYSSCDIFLLNRKPTKEEDYAIALLDGKYLLFNSQSNIGKRFNPPAFIKKFDFNKNLEQSFSREECEKISKTSNQTLQQQFVIKGKVVSSVDNLITAFSFNNSIFIRQCQQNLNL